MPRKGDTLTTEETDFDGNPDHFTLGLGLELGWGKVMSRVTDHF